MSIIGLLVFILIVALVFWAVRAIAGAFSLPPQIVVVIQVLLVFVAVLYLLSAFGLISGGPVIRVQ